MRYFLFTYRPDLIWRLYGKAQSAGGMWVTGFSTPPINTLKNEKKENPKNEKMQDVDANEKKM